MILARQAPFTHNFTPFLDTRPGVAPDARYKALAGSGGTGLIAFKSADGIHWSKIQDAPVIKDAESGPRNALALRFVESGLLVRGRELLCLFCPHLGHDRASTDGSGDKKFQRRVSRTTSTDFITWTPLVNTDTNLPGEQLYTNETHPYFRAPHIYVAIAE